MATLDEAVGAILDDIVAAIEAAANETSGGLNEVKTVVRGNHARPMPSLPAIWVISQPLTAETSQYGDGEEVWTLDVSLAALVKDTDPETAARTAQRLAARALNAAQTIRRPRTRDYIIDVVSRSFDAFVRRGGDEGRPVYWADAVVRVTFTANDTAE